MKNPLISIPSFVRHTGLVLFFGLLAAPSFADNVEVLVVAGGGGGGGPGSGEPSGRGGGGGGGVRYNAAYTVTIGTGISVTVGGGGANDAVGNNSSFGTLTAIGGGQGATTSTGPGNGGSGGGGQAVNGGNYGGTPGTGTSGQGSNGGYGYSDGATYSTGGGGGGAGGVGATPVYGNPGGTGGVGVSYSISGSTAYYGGGGGGGGDHRQSFATGGSGGNGGGGSGSVVNGGTGSAGTANTGGGGGGGGYGGTGGAGGSGVVIVRYSGSARATGGTIISVGGYTIHAFTSSGTFTLQSLIPVITSATTASGSVGQAANYTIVATNTPTSYGATDLPPGLSVDPSTGIISGTPTTAGSYNSTVTATNGNGPGSGPVVWTISGPTVTVTPAGTGVAIINGNVGIGTTNPTQKLSVNGKIRAKEVIVDTGWSDYVFATDYRLASLGEVEAHIKREGHLPGIPSAQEVAEHGVSMGEMQAKLLAKVEELTLHQIAQEKRLNAQAEQLATLEAENSALRQP